MPISLTGMASGLDTDSIIQRLMAIDQQKVTAVQNQQSGVQAHQNALKAIQSKLDAALTAGAGIGGHTVTVSKLASSAQHGLAFTPSATAGLLTPSYGNEP